MGRDVSYTKQGRFHCPCHNSIYDRYGQIISGPATRPMDRFPISVDENKLVVDTGQPIIRTKSDPAEGMKLKEWGGTIKKI